MSGCPFLISNNIVVERLTGYSVNNNRSSTYTFEFRIYCKNYFSYCLSHLGRFSFKYLNRHTLECIKITCALKFIELHS